MSLKKICDVTQMQDKWGIYAHVPWCRRRCPYCDFYLEVGRPFAHYTDLLLREFDSRRALWPFHPAASLYFGGGTPSLVSALRLGIFIESLKKSGAVGLDAEISLEANPEDISEEIAYGLAQAGVNRISLGIQSLDDTILHQLGRKHRKNQALEAISFCKKAKIARTSVDLIVGVPSESLVAVSESIAIFKDLGVEHISAYLLTVEPGTNLEKLISKGKRQFPGDEAQADAYEHVQSHMAHHGYRQYEISSYALPGFESKHNRNYWGKGPYLGLGPSAHSMRLLCDGRVERSYNVASLFSWQSSVIPGEANRQIEILAAKDAFLEAIAFGLRDLLLGVDLEALSKRHQWAINSKVYDIIHKNIQRGWVNQTITNESTTFHLTATGVRFADAVARDILSSCD